MFFPILTPIEILFWNEKPYKCLIVGSNYDDMMMAGFHYVLPKRGERQAESDFFCELKVEDPSVQQAFNSFKTLLLLVVPYLASVKISTLQTCCNTVQHFPSFCGQSS